MKEISAVIFSCIATHGKLRSFALPENAFVEFFGVRLDSDAAPVQFRKINSNYSEHIQDGIYVFHNPYAERPLPVEVFRHRGIMQHYYSYLNRHMAIEGVDDFLVMRMAHIYYVKR